MSLFEKLRTLWSVDETTKMNTYLDYIGELIHEYDAKGNVYSSFDEFINSRFVKLGMEDRIW